MTSEKIFELIEERRAEMEAVLDFMENHADIGYCEWDASEYLENAYKKLGYTLTMAGNIPGFLRDRFYSDHVSTGDGKRPWQCKPSEGKRGHSDALRQDGRMRHFSCGPCNKRRRAGRSPSIGAYG